MPRPVHRFGHFPPRFGATIGFVAPVEESWTRIVAWLTETAPATAAQIGPPASAEQVAEVERVVGRPLPADLTAWWRLAGGLDRDAMDPLIPATHIPLTIADSLEIRRFWLNLHLRLGESIADGEAGEPSRGFQSTFVPISTDCGGRYLFVDLRDGPLHGCVAEWDDKFSFDDAIHWPSVTDMLSDIADALTHGTPARTFHAAGRLRHFAANPEMLVDTYRAAVSSTGRLTWTGESF
jgi:cell wall assembly regulator SMI1